MARYVRAMRRLLLLPLTLFLAIAVIAQTGVLAQTVPPPRTAETAVSATVDGSKIAILPVAISAVKFADGSPATIPGFAGYDATASYSSAGVQMLSVRGGPAPYAAPTTSIGATQTTFSQSQAGAFPQPPTTVANLVPILVGSALVAYNLTVTFTSITDTDGFAIDGGAPVVKAFRRGDTNGDGNVTVVDALFIAQFLAGKRPIIAMNALNAATPRHDGAAGDKITIVDALYIAQYKATLRDASYNQLF